MLSVSSSLCPFTLRDLLSLPFTVSLQVIDSEFPDSCISPSFWEDYYDFKVCSIGTRLDSLLIYVYLRRS